MLNYLEPRDVIGHSGLRLVLVKGLPSPWGQAAKTIFELKGLPFVVGALLPGATNDEYTAWAGENSGPLVAWQDEKPIHRWLDILHLAERLAPAPSLLPADARDRALMIGFSHEICGELGIGWNRRLQLFAPFIDSGKPPEGVARMGSKYRYNAGDAALAGARTAASLRALAAQLKDQYARDQRYFIGDRLSALDIYWTAFANLLDPLPAAQCPMPEDWRPGFVASDPEIRAALDPLLLEHRDRIFKACFRSPMEF